MKLCQISEKISKQKKETAEEASARYEKFKKMLAAGNPGVTQQQVDGIKRIADSLWNDKFKTGEKDLTDVHGAEWWELASKQYPVTQSSGEYIVKSNFALDPDSGKRGPWHFDNEGQAKDKVVQLVKWLSGGRKKGYGDKDADIQRWFKKLDSVDKSKSTNESIDPAESDLRANMISRIESFFGTLQTVSYHKISTQELTQMYDALLDAKQIKPIKSQ